MVVTPFAHGEGGEVASARPTTTTSDSKHASEFGSTSTPPPSAPRRWGRCSISSVATDRNPPLAPAFTWRTARRGLERAGIQQYAPSGSPGAHGRGRRAGEARASLGSLGARSSIDSLQRARRDSVGIRAASEVADGGPEPSSGFSSTRGNVADRIILRGNFPHVIVAGQARVSECRLASCSIGSHLTDGELTSNHDEHGNQDSSRNARRHPSGI